MRMSDPVDTEAMKVPDATEALSPSNDMAPPRPDGAEQAATWPDGAEQDPPRPDRAEQGLTKPDGAEQGPPSPEQHCSNNKRDAQSSTRLKLVRSLAVCEESFPCPIPEPSAEPQDGFLLQPFEKEDGAPPDQAEKEDGCDRADKPEKMPRKMLSRDSSQDYTDSTGIDLHEFLVNTLKGNPRDRIMLLKLEQDILDFISNNESQKRKFPPMTSYHRMLLHRVAAYFGMDHNVDPSGKSVVINKTTNTRIPDQKFSEHIKDDRADDFQKRYILKRDNSSFDREDSMIRMRLKADKRSKSMEEREEEYQRARERIFAHDGDHFILDRSAPDEDACMSTQQRRQMFRLRAGRSGASRQSSSETDTLPPRPGEPRPWSSTDSSDSSNRLAPRPPITKASSFSGLVRGDSTASSKSTGRLSKTGSESCSSSVGSSSSSLSRPQPALPPAPSSSSWSAVPSSAPLLRPPVVDSSRGPGRPEAPPAVKIVQTRPPSAADTPSYYVLPLDASGIPAGSVLVNPHTGKPFIHPDGSAVVYNPPLVGRHPQQGKAQQQQPIPALAQQHTANHLHSQPICPPIQLSSEPVHTPALSYPLPPLPPPSQFLPVCPNQQYSVPDALNAQFGHMTLAHQQQPGEGGASAADSRHYPGVYHTPQQQPPPPALPLSQQQQQQQVAGYMVAGPLAGHHPGVLQGQPVPLQAQYHSSTPGPGPFPGPPLNQQLLQQHTYIQQPLQQMSTCYCSSAHHPHCSSQQQQQQHYRPPGPPLPYNCPQGQNLPPQQVHQAVLPGGGASGYQAVVGVQPAAGLALPGNQQSNMGSQMQGMMVQYPPMQSYQQVSMPQQPYQQPVFVSCQPGQGALAVAGMQPCYSLLPANQHTTMSSTVSFLPAQMMEQLQFPPTSPPCLPQQHPGQPYAGLLSPGPGGSMVMLQMTGPPYQQQPRALSPCQRKPPGHKHPGGPEQQRGRRQAELPPPPPADRTQSSLSPSPGQPPSARGPPSGISSIHLHHQQQQHHPQLRTAFCHSGQGEAQFSLLGQPLQYKPSIRPPLIHTAHMVAKHQGPLGVWRGAHGRKSSSRKPLSSDLSVGEAVSSQIPAVTDPPGGLTGCTDPQQLLAELGRGPLIPRPRLCGTTTRDTPAGGLAPYSILSMFPSRYSSPQAPFRLHKLAPDPKGGCVVGARPPPSC